MKLPNLTPIIAFITGLLFKKDRTADRRKIIRLIEWIKKIVESDTTQIIINIARVLKLDQKFLDFVKKHLPGVLTKTLGLSNESVITNIAIKQAILTLRNMPKSVRIPYWEVMAGELYQNVTGMPKYQSLQAMTEMKTEYDLMKQGGLLS